MLRLMMMMMMAMATVVNAQLMTWNIGLEEHWATERAPIILDVLANDTANSTMSIIEVVCLTEVWTGPITIKDYILGLKNVYPYSLSLLDDSFINASSSTKYSPPCLDYYSDEVAASKMVDFADCFLSCVTSGAADDDDVFSKAYSCGVQCLLSTFADVFQGEEKNTNPCWACLLETMFNAYKIYTSPEGTVSFTDSIRQLSTCYTDTSQPWSQTLGLLVLSKVPIELVEIGFLDTFMAPRGYIAFNVPSWSNTLVVCTHVTPINDDLPYTTNYSTPYTSWAEENIGSTKQIISKMSQSPFNNYSNQIITGDLNHSPGLQSIEAIAPEAYDMLKSWSFGSDSNTMENLYISTNYKFNLVDEEGNSTLCSACVTNNVCPTIPPRLYDFAWTKGPYWNFTNDDGMYSYRLYDETVKLMVNGDCLESKLSDHYPVIITTRSPLLNHQLAKTSWCTSTNSASAVSFIPYTPDALTALAISTSLVIYFANRL